MTDKELMRNLRRIEMDLGLQWEATYVRGAINHLNELGYALSDLLTALKANEGPEALQAALNKAVETLMKGRP